MTFIPRGGNAPVPAVPLRILVGHAHSPSVPGIEAVALLLDAGGGCRPGRSDVVGPTSTPHPSGAVGYAGRTDGHGQSAIWLDVNLTAVEPDVERVVFIASVDGIEGLVFGMVPGLYIQAQGYDGVPVARHEITGAAQERAILLGEVYRRDGGWRFRAIGQGYASGLAGVVADFQRSAPAPQAAHIAQSPELYRAPVAPPDRYAPGADVPPFVPEHPNGTTGTMRAPVAGHSYAPGHRIVDPTPPAGPATPPGFLAPDPGHQAPQFQAPAPAPGHPYTRPHGPSYAQSYGQSYDTAPADPFAAFPSFSPQLIRGHGSATPSFHQPLPRGPVILEMVFRDRDTDWPVVYQLNRRRETGNLLLSGEGDDFVARTPAIAPDSYPLSLEIITTAEWTITALPLSSARRLLVSVPLNGHTHDVLAYHGPDAELEIEYRGEPGRHDATMSLTALGPGELDMDDADFVQTDCLLMSAIGPFRQRVHLNGGARLIHVDAKGSWTLTAHPL
ncbi:TerD family protein [Streptomyces sp. NPDC058953]|uniref:TerD family protein n=1 Tax=unclassified Streptomyces TaxID=2593676 RepID=UPI0036A38A70